MPGAAGDGGAPGSPKARGRYHGFPAPRTPRGGVSQGWEPAALDERRTTALERGGMGITAPPARPASHRDALREGAATIDSRNGPIAENVAVASRLDEVARLLEDQRANPWRVGSYRRSAAMLRGLPQPIGAIARTGGVAALEELPTIGPTLARAIHQLVMSGRLAMLDRLRGAADPEHVLRTVPGIGRITAHRLHDLGIETLEDLEAAAHDGRLAALAGFGPKRLAGIRDALAYRLGRIRTAAAAPRAGAARAKRAPTVAELLDVDREYRERAAAGSLPRIAPRRFNPRGEAWLPILHTERGGRHYTALFSNTARAHELGKTGDWVVLYLDGARGDGQYTVITAERGPLRGRRIVRGRDVECARRYARAP